MDTENNHKISLNYWLLLSFFTIVFLGAITTIIFNIKTTAAVNAGLAKQQEAKRPAKLELTVISDKNCPDCFNVNAILEKIKNENVNIESQKTLDRSSEEGKELISQFNIDRLPTFIFKGEINKNETLKKYFAGAGVVNDGVFVFKQTGGPYVAASTGAIKGRTKLTMITDITCKECYDVTQHESILAQFGLQPSSQVVDLKSALGQSFIKAYAIKSVPTFVLSGELSEYPSLKSAWPQVGIVARDGAYVFTKGVPLMGVYKDLITNKITYPSAE